MGALRPAEASEQERAHAVQGDRGGLSARGQGEPDARGAVYAGADARRNCAKPWPLKVIIDNVLLGKPLPPYLSFAEGCSVAEDVGAGGVLAGDIADRASLGAFAYLQVYMTSRIGNELVYTLRRSLFSHLQRLSLSFHNGTRSGELMTKIVSDTNTLRTCSRRRP